MVSKKALSYLALTEDINAYNSIGGISPLFLYYSPAHISIPSHKRKIDGISISSLILSIEIIN